MRYAEITEWLDDCRGLHEEEWDDIHLFTGEEGYGKSRKMRQIFRKLDPTFGVHRIHFNQDDFLDQAVTLDPGQAILLDEWRGHKRLAMHGERMEFLDFLKECRGLGLHTGIGFPHVTQVEKDVLFQRVRWWNDSTSREVLNVHRRLAKSRLDSEGHPTVDVRFPLVGKFPFPDTLPDPLGQEYRVKKLARMKDRAARFRENHGGKEMSNGQDHRRLNWTGTQAFIDEVQAELRRSQ